MGDNIFAERLVQARDAKKMTMRALSQAAGVSPQSMSQYAKGESMPPLRSAIKLAEALGVSLDWLCGLQEEAVVEKQQHSVETYGDVARTLLQMENHPALHFSVHPADNGDLTCTLTGCREIGQFFEKLHIINGVLSGLKGEQVLSQEWADLMLEKLDGLDLLPF